MALSVEMNSLTNEIDGVSPLGSMLLTRLGNGLALLAIFPKSAR